MRAAPHTGRGGWTWYTGSAGWMYRLVVESLLGLRLDVDRLHIAPCLPPDWKEFKLHYRHGEATYHITVRQIAVQRGEVAATVVIVDGVAQEGDFVLLRSDAQEHLVDVRVALAITDPSLIPA